MKHQQALLDQPLIDGESAIQPLRSMVGNYEHDRVVVEQFEYAADLLIEPGVVIGNSVLVGISRLEQHMLRIVEIPEPVVHAVQADVNKVKIIPLLFTD